jgi:prepilin-type N-terminal cleavage/methylation domain-containing protein/prepilin-type processing-associated H-X9-DG protein
MAFAPFPHYTSPVIVNRSTKVGRRPGARGFTLTEVLVAIAIVGTLAVLLTPVAKSVVTNSRSAKCSSNLRALGAAWLTYANEHEGRLASTGWVNTESNTDYPGLRDYVDLPASLGGQPWQRATVFTCPVLQSNPETATKENFLRTYGVNEVACDLYFPGAIPSIQKRRMVNIRKPSQFAVAMDGAIPAGSSPATRYATTCSNREGKEKLVQLPHGPVNARVANVLYADGHVAGTEPKIIQDTSPLSIFWRDPAN